MGRIIPPAGVRDGRREDAPGRERAHLERFLRRIQSVLEQHEVFEAEPWPCRLQERITACNARLARYG